MKIERLSQDKIRIFLTFDDLTERGIHKDDMWREIPKVHELFSEMMDQAYNELGFDATGPLAVEVFALPAQGMVVIVTRGSMKAKTDFVTEDDQDELYELEVTLEETDLISYAFTDLDHLIDAAKILKRMVSSGGRLYAFRDRYILQMEPLLSSHTEDDSYESIIAVLSEYGEATSVTPAVLEEYGKIVIADDAIHTLCNYF